MTTYFFTTVEFYVILAVIAAAIVALACRPTDRKPAEEYLLAGNLEERLVAAAPSLRIRVGEGGRVRLQRRGLEGICLDGAVSLAVKVIDGNVMIEERIVPGQGMLMPMCTADFDVKFLREGGRYHVKYNSEPTSRFAAFPLSVIEGIDFEEALK